MNQINTLQYMYQIALTVQNFTTWKAFFLQKLNSLKSLKHLQIDNLFISIKHIKDIFKW